MEFITQIKTPAVIDGNFAEVKRGLENMMTAYSEIVVTEDNIPDCKKDVATLRKIKKAIDDKRKEVKKEHEKPLKEFESKCKELTGVIDAEIERINHDLSSYEMKRRTEKQAVIRKLYDENIEEYAEYLPLDSIYDERWENKSCSEKEIVSDIQQEKLRFKTDLQTIQIAAGEFADDCLDWYKKHWRDLPATMRRLEDLRSAKDRAEAVLKAEKNFAEEVRDECTKTAENAENERQMWTFNVFSVDDANSVRAYLEMFEIKYMEGYIK